MPKNQEEKPSIAKVVVSTDTISLLKHSNLRSWNKESEKILLMNIAVWHAYLKQLQTKLSSSCMLVLTLHGKWN